MNYRQHSSHLLSSGSLIHVSSPHGGTLAHTRISIPVCVCVREWGEGGGMCVREREGRGGGRYVCEREREREGGREGKSINLESFPL